MTVARFWSARGSEIIITEDIGGDGGGGGRGGGWTGRGGGRGIGGGGAGPSGPAAMVQPDFANVILLIDDGAHLSTTFVDVSDTPHSPTAGLDVVHNNASLAFAGDTSSILFDGDSDHLNIPDHADFDLNGDVHYGMDCAFKTSVGGLLIAKYDFNSQRAFQFEVEIATGKCRFILYHSRTTGGSALVYTSDTVCTDDEWHHVCFTHEEVPSENWVGRLFVDGVLEHEEGHTQTLQIDDTTPPVRVGIDNNGNGDFTGRIAWPRMWKNTLGPTETFINPTEGPPLS